MTDQNARILATTHDESGNCKNVFSVFARLVKPAEAISVGGAMRLPRFARNDTPDSKS
jgi:hypothetical protein